MVSISIQSPQHEERLCDITHESWIYSSHQIKNNIYTYNTHIYININIYLRRFLLERSNDQFEGNNQENCNGHISVAVLLSIYFLKCVFMNTHTQTRQHNNSNIEWGGLLHHACTNFVVFSLVSHSHSSLPLQWYVSQVMVSIVQTHTRFYASAFCKNNRK